MPNWISADTAKQFLCMTMYFYIDLWFNCLSCVQIPHITFHSSTDLSISFIIIIGYPQLIHSATLHSLSLDHLCRLLSFLGVSHPVIWLGTLWSFDDTTTNCNARSTCISAYEPNNIYTNWKHIYFLFRGPHHFPHFNWFSFPKKMYSDQYAVLLIGI